MEMQKYLADVDLGRMERINAIRADYEAGRLTLPEARRRLKAQVSVIYPYEIAVAEQATPDIDPDECKKVDIQAVLELYEGLLDTHLPDLPEDHPIRCYVRENDKMRELLLSVEDLVQYPVIKNQWLGLYDELRQFKVHLSRKQNQLYAILEQKGFTRPSTTMWQLDNFIRDEINDAYEKLLNDEEEAFIAMQQTIVDDVRDLMAKEETVLYPTALAMIKPAEFDTMKAGDKEIGFAWIKVGQEDETDDTPSAAPKAGGTPMQDLFAKHGQKIDVPGGRLNVSTGWLTLEQINLIFRHMPVDLSYVDEKDIVSFYTDTKERVFPRSRNVIGRVVQNCHPRSSVHIVQEIIDKFRAGEEDTVDFWINKPGFFIYIKYVAVRDEDGTFRGVLEMMQNCTRIRGLQGSRTLLTWGSGEGEVIDEEPEAADDQASDTDTTTTADLPELTWSAETRLKDILQRWPALKAQMSDIDARFALLKTPLARVMIPKATIAMMSERVGMTPQALIDAIKEKIKTL